MHNQQFTEFVITRFDCVLLFRSKKMKKIVLRNSAPILPPNKKGLKNCRNLGKNSAQQIHRKVESEKFSAWKFQI